MKTLLLMRHAKSSWKHPELADHDRPLAKRGVKAAHQMGDLIVQKELVPQLILTSGAMRTVETARLLCQICNCSDQITPLEEFYLAEPDAYIAKLKTLPDDLERVMIVGHNPGLESLLQILSGQIETLPTAALAHISLPIKSWKELTPETESVLVDLWRPKELPEDVMEKKADKKKPKAVKVKEEKAKPVKEKSEKPKKKDGKK